MVRSATPFLPGAGSSVLYRPADYADQRIRSLHGPLKGHQTLLDLLRARGIDPRQVAVTRTIADLGNGPGHSLMLLPDKKTAAINVAGDNAIAVIDVASGQIKTKLPTGKFPCDLHFTPDGRYAYTPERDQDTVNDRYG